MPSSKIKLYTIYAVKAYLHFFVGDCSSLTTFKIPYWSQIIVGSTNSYAFVSKVSR